MTGLDITSDVDIHVALMVVVALGEDILADAFMVLDRLSTPCIGEEARVAIVIDVATRSLTGAFKFALKSVEKAVAGAANFTDGGVTRYRNKEIRRS